MIIPEDQIREIASKSSLLDIAQNYIRIEKKGSRFWACCPFHQEKTPSFTINPETNTFHCFGCKKSGDIYTFIQETEGMTFVESVQFLAEKLGIELQQGSAEFDKEKTSQRDSLYELYNKLTQTFHYLLLEDPRGKKALEYIQRRSVSMSTIRKFQLGFVLESPYWLHDFLISKKYSQEFLLSSGLFAQNSPRYSLFHNRLIFPIFDRHNRPIAFGGRVLDGDGPKYINSPETQIFHKRKNLYNMNNARDYIKKQGRFILVEGYMDVISLHEAGIEEAVAPLGTSFTEDQAKSLARLSSQGILFFDADTAGLNAFKKAAILLEQTGIFPKTIPSRKHKDPGDILQKDGKEALHKLLKYPINSFEYFVDQALEQVQADSAEGKEAVLREVFPYIRSIDSKTRQDSYLSILAERLKLRVEAVYQDFALNEKSKKPFQKQENNEQNTDEFDQNIATITPNSSGETYLMLAAAVHPEDFSIIRKYLALDELKDHFARKLYIVLEDIFRSGDMTIETVLHHLHDTRLKQAVLQKQSEGEFDINREKLIMSSIYRVKQNKLFREKEEKLAQIRETQNDERISDLMADIIAIDNELKKLQVGI
jgi:DNA primase